MRTPRAGGRWSRGRITRRAGYAAYLGSAAWQDKGRDWYRHWVAVHAGPPTCLVCGRRWSLRTGHLHHVTYMRLGCEQPEDLIPLCAADHTRLHEVFDHSAQWRRQGRAVASFGIVALLRRRFQIHAEGAAT